MKKILALALVLMLAVSCSQLQDLAKQLPDTAQSLTDADIARALKQALNQGIDKEVSKLMQTGGFYNQPDVRILFPPELQKVENTLRKIGLGSLADEGVRKLNRAAEEAVKEAKPIFVQAIKEMSIQDARNILMGDSTAATRYLQEKTREQLYRKFYPIVKSNFAKVGADKIWNRLISRYNQVPFVQKVNPDLTDYVTNQALQGVYRKIAVEEVKIRKDVRERTTDLLRKVFALQDRNP